MSDFSCYLGYTQNVAGTQQLFLNDLLLGGYFQNLKTYLGFYSEENSAFWWTFHLVLNGVAWKAEGYHSGNL